MATVTFDHVWKKFGDVIAVNDLTLDIQDEEFLVLVGPSGCGKTTSLRMIAGLEEVTSGTVMIADRVVNDLAPKDRDVAMVFQSYALYPHMSVKDNLAFGLKLRKVPKADIERRVAEAAKILDLSPLLDRKPKALSGGQRQRVALGRAIVREPKVFLMDEPLSNLDAKLRVATRAELSRLHQRLRTTIVYVTHDQVEAMTMGTRIAVMNQGLLQQVGPPQELYERPVNRFVAGFIGSPSMNFLPMTVTKSDGSIAFTGADLTLPAPSRFLGALASRDGREVTVGFRPEHLSLVDVGPEAVTIHAAADVVEYLGNDELLHLRVGDLDLVAVVDAAHRVQVGQQLALRLPHERLYVFDGETEEAITAEATAGATAEATAAA
jgi:multiple sugar transport system ATP-binding protein